MTFGSPYWSTIRNSKRKTYKAKQSFDWFLFVLQGRGILSVEMPLSFIENRRKPHKHKQSKEVDFAKKSPLRHESKRTFK
jgi:hypothetical protein